MTAITEQPQRFGNYYLLKKLCAGKSTEIFLALRLTKYTSNFYIIKKFTKPLVDSDSSKIQAFIQEGQIATSMTHQNIVHGHEYGEQEFADKLTYYLAIDYVFGKNLAQLQQKKALRQIPLEVTLKIISSVARALIYAHTYRDPFTLKVLPIIHKDISPDNILISYGGEVKISDFGISQIGISDQIKKKITGKLRYMAPEQLQNKTLDIRCDIFSLGVLFWECLTGERLFDDRKETDIRNGTVSFDAPHPTEVGENIPVGIGDLCMKCMRQDPEERFQSVLELKKALNDCIANGGYPDIDLKEYMQQVFGEEYTKEASLLQEIKKNITPPPTEEKKSIPDIPKSSPDSSIISPPDIEDQLTALTPLIALSDNENTETQERPAAMMVATKAEKTYGNTLSNSMAPPTENMELALTSIHLNKSLEIHTNPNALTLTHDEITGTFER